jgi:hypothetical protein
MNASGIRRVWAVASLVILLALVTVSLAGCSDYYQLGKETGKILRVIAERTREFWKGLADGFGAGFCQAALLPVLALGLIAVRRLAQKP